MGPHSRDTELLEHYWKGQRRVQLMAREYAGYFMKKDIREKIKDSGVCVCPAICISRNIGVGAIEVGEMLSRRLGFPVLDRQIIEQISSSADLSSQSIETFDERYPGRIKELMCTILGDRAFDMNDYARELFYAAFFLAHMESSIFVGRGIHLMLPRDHVFAVRFVSSRKRRIDRLAESLKIDVEKALRLLNKAEKEQREFFQLVHQKVSAPADEFDLVMNLDYIDNSETAADAIMLLFKNRFPGKLNNQGLHFGAG